MKLFSKLSVYLCIFGIIFHVNGFVTMAVDPALTFSYNCDSLTDVSSVMPMASIAIETNDKYSGIGSIKVTQGSSWGGVVFQKFSLEKDVKYRFSAYAKSVVCADVSKERVGISLWFKHNGTQVQVPWYNGTNSNTINKTTWRTVYADFTISSTTYPGIITEVMFFATTANGATDVFLIDDVAICKSPTIKSTYPADSATEVPVSSEIDVAFSNYMDASTLNTTNITIDNGANIKEILPQQDNQANCKIILEPLLYNTKYTVRIQNVKDLYGMIVPTKSISFTTSQTRLNFQSVKFYKDYNEATATGTDITQTGMESGKITCVAEVKNGGEPIVASLIVVLYKGGELVDMSVMPNVTFPKDHSISKSLWSSVTIDGTASEYRIMAFVWSGLDSMIGLSKYATFDSTLTIQ